MNIAVAKLKTMLYFGKLPDKMKRYGNFDNPSAIIYNMAKYYPGHNFYITCSSDYNKLPETEKLPNIIDYASTIKKYTKDNNTIYNTSLLKDDKSKRAYYKAFVDYANNNNIKFDISILIMDGGANIALYDEGIKNVRDDKFAKPRMADRTYAPIAYIMNNISNKNYIIADDPRELKSLPKDIKHIDKIISQVNSWVYKTTILDDLKTRTKIPIEIIYRPIEAMFLTTKEEPKLISSKTNDFIMVLHGNNHRYKMVKEWILNYKPNQIVYGDWTGTFNMGSGIDTGQIKKDGNDKNFIDIPMCDLTDILYNSKYTFIPPVENSWNNFVTQKLWSMIYYGIIPFIPKEHYDTDRIFDFIPEYLRVKTPDEMWNKINVLNNNTHKYNELLYNINDSLLKSGYFNKETIIKKIFDGIL